MYKNKKDYYKYATRIWTSIFYNANDVMKQYT